MNKIFKNKKLNYFIFGILIVVAVLVWLAVFQNKSSKDLKIVFCDVGQGDAIFIQKSLNEDFLIDGGPDNSVLNCLGNNMPYYDRKIKSIVLTHPHADHMIGLIEVLKRYEIEEVWLTGVNDDSANYLEFQKIITEKMITTKIAKAGEMIENSQDLSLKILYPLDSLGGQNFENLNLSSIVIQLKYHNLSAILTGDLEESKQSELLTNYSQLKADILKVPHHGSADGLLTEFLSQVNPSVAVISVGKNNRYGHPSSKILDKLQKIAGLAIYRTDKNGEIKILSNGQDYEVQTAK